MDGYVGRCVVVVWMDGCVGRCVVFGWICE